MADQCEAMDERILGRYRLRSRIGYGRLGAVYEAIDESSLVPGAGRPVAIQILDPIFASDPDFVDKLRRGYAALRAGSHPNVVELLELGRDGELGFLTMELLQGASLRFVLDCESSLPVDEVIAVVRGVGDALQYLHAKSMFHGRVTPENVLVTDDFEVKLLDLAPVLPASPLPGLGIPTRAPDARDDVFDTACLVYELLTGRHPFNSNSPIEARRAGLEPDRIASLSTSRWQALAGGLVLQHKLRTPTIRDFLSEFGVQGTERLRVEVGAGPRSRVAPQRRPASEQTPARVRAPDQTVSQASSSQAPPPRTLPPRTPPPRVPLPTPEPIVVRPRHSGPALAPERRGGTRLGRLAGVALIAGAIAAAAIYREPLAQWAVDWTARLEATADRIAEEESSAGRDPTALARSDSAAAPRPSSPEQLPSEQLPLEQAPLEQAPLEQASVPARSEPVPRPATRPDAETSQRGEPIPARDETAVSSFSAAATTLTVAEDAVTARVPLRRIGDASIAVSLVWWTGDRTALAGDDYAGVAEHWEQLAPGEPGHDLYVPLIDDSLPEPDESFLVYLGRYGEVDGQLETVAEVTVRIVDDD